jgi:hypothetical protein
MRRHTLEYWLENGFRCVEFLLHTTTQTSSIEAYQSSTAISQKLFQLQEEFGGEFSQDVKLDAKAFYVWETFEQFHNLCTFLGSVVRSTGPDAKALNSMDGT